MRLGEVPAQGGQLGLGEVGQLDGLGCGWQLRRVRRVQLGRRLVRLPTLFQLGAEAGAESLFGVVLGGRHQNSSMMLRTAGPRMTMNMAGKMKITVGKSILIGDFIAFSSAAAWRFRRDSDAWRRRSRPSEIPSWSAWMMARQKLATSGVAARSASFLSAS